MNNKADILNELKAISSLLYDTKNQTKEDIVAPTYFNNLANDIWSKIELEEETPSLLSVINKEIKDIPTTYFDDFYSNIDLPKTKKINISSTILSWKSLSIAASIIGVIFIGLSFIIKQNNTHNELNILLADVTTNDVQNYITENITEFDATEVQSVFNTNLDSIKLIAVNTNKIQPIEEAVAINNVNIQEDIDKTIIDNIDANSIEEYLEEHPATFDYYDDETYIF